jgi:hypothetical protein
MLLRVEGNRTLPDLRFPITRFPLSLFRHVTPSSVSTRQAFGWVVQRSGATGGRETQFLHRLFGRAADCRARIAASAGERDVCTHHIDLLRRLVKRLLNEFITESIVTIAE